MRACSLVRRIDESSRIHFNNSLPGESVPVSKMPVTEDVLDDLDLKAPSIHPTVAKHFLFYGTKIIRARRPRHSDGEVEAVALGIALRTGFSTTKGSLVRSMLFSQAFRFQVLSRLISVYIRHGNSGIARFYRFIRELYQARCKFMSSTFPTCGNHLTKIAPLAYGCYQGSGSHHYRCATGSSSNSDYRDKFCLI